MGISRWVLYGCIATVLLAGCGQRGTVRPDDRTRLPVGNKNQEVARQLREEASRWQGTPHRMGSSDFNGVDCSGLVKNIYRDLFGIQLPRTARGQAGQGRWIEKNALEPGDLVFFKPPGKKDHVGIYLGRGEFVHASSSRGVTISDLDSTYWRRYYWTARRVRGR